MAASHRDVSPILKLLRKLLLGRVNKNALRFTDTIAARTQPPPNLPDGPHHKLSSNYYFTRDARRENQPPLLVANCIKSQAALPAGQNQGAGVVVPSTKSSPTPGVTYSWKKSPTSPF